MQDIINLKGKMVNIIGKNAIGRVLEELPLEVRVLLLNGVVVTVNKSKVTTDVYHKYSILEKMESNIYGLEDKILIFKFIDVVEGVNEIEIQSRLKLGKRFEIIPLNSLNEFKSSHPMHGDTLKDLSDKSLLTMYGQLKPEFKCQNK